MWAALQHHCFQRKTCLDSLRTQVPENTPSLSISPSTVLHRPHKHEVFFILLPQTMPVSAGQRKRKKKKVHILSVASNLSLKETKRETAGICKKICEYCTLSMLLRSRVFPVLKNCTHGWALTSGHRTTGLDFNSEELLVFAGHHLCVDNGENNSTTDQQCNKFVMAAHCLSLFKRSSVVDTLLSVCLSAYLSQEEKD